MAKKVRANGQGALYYDKKKKTYRGQVVIGIDEEGRFRRKSVSGKTKSEVENKMNIIRAENYFGDLMDKDSLANAHMFLNFRKEIDKLAFPLLQEYGDFIPIMDDNQKVGFLLVVDGYVEGIWVQPQHRRKGLAKKTVLDYINNGGEINILDVVITNVSADLFWNSIFEMEQLRTTFCDKRYRVLGVK